MPKVNKECGRDGSGRFLPGNKCATGNPLASRVARLRAEMLDAVRPADIRRVIQALISSAEQGDTAASKVLLEKVLGPAVPLDILERLDALERMASENMET